MKKYKLEYKSRVDTIDTRTSINNVEELMKDIDHTMNGIRISNSRKIGEISTIYNPNKVNGEYSTEYKLSVTERNLETLMDIQTIINKDEVYKTRVDINTDISMDFNSNFKVLNMLHKCFTLNLQSKSQGQSFNWNKQDDDTLNMCSLCMKNQNYFVEYYDKKTESNGVHKYDTRLEVRFIRIKAQDLEFHIDKAISLYKNTLANFEIVEKRQITKLIKKYDEYMIKNPSATFREFVSTYNNHILTMDIFKALYSYSGMKGNIRVWISRYRTGHDFDLVTKSDIKGHCDNIVKSLKSYKKL